MGGDHHHNITFTFQNVIKKKIVDFHESWSLCMTSNFNKEVNQDNNNKKEEGMCSDQHSTLKVVC